MPTQAPTTFLAHCPTPIPTATPTAHERGFLQKKWTKFRTPAKPQCIPHCRFFAMANLRNKRDNVNQKYDFYEIVPHTWTRFSTSASRFGTLLFLFPHLGISRLKPGGCCIPGGQKPPLRARRASTWGNKKKRSKTPGYIAILCKCDLIRR